MMNIKILNSDVSCNTYIIEEENNAIIIDCGASIENILNNTKCKICAVLLTHAHFDHITYLEEYVKKLNVKIYLNYNALEKLFDALKNGSHQFSNTDFVISKENTLNNLITISEGKQQIENISFDAIELPGHSSCGMGYIFGDNFFCGDTIFARGYGRYDFYDSSFCELRKSIRKISNLSIKTLYPGHEDSFLKNK